MKEAEIMSSCNATNEKENAALRAELVAMKNDWDIEKRAHERTWNNMKVRTDERNALRAELDETKKKLVSEEECNERFASRLDVLELEHAELDALKAEASKARLPAETLRRLIDITSNPDMGGGSDGDMVSAGYQHGRLVSAMRERTLRSALAAFCRTSINLHHDLGDDDDCVAGCNRCRLNAAGVAALATAPASDALERVIEVLKLVRLIAPTVQLAAIDEALALLGATP